MFLLFIQNFYGWLVSHWRIVAICGGVLVLLFLMISIRNCGRKPIRIDELQIQTINTANEKQRKAELEKIIAENSDTIKTVDQRTEIAEVNVIEREREIDAKIAAVDKKIQEAKSNGKNVTSDELECLLTGDKCQ